MIITVKEAAEQLGISPQRVRVLLAQGRLKGKKLGHDWAVMGLEYNRMKRGKKHQKTHDELASDLAEMLIKEGYLREYEKYRRKKLRYRNKNKT